MDGTLRLSTGHYIRKRRICKREHVRLYFFMNFRKDGDPNEKPRQRYPCVCNE